MDNSVYKRNHAANKKKGTLTSNGLEKQTPNLESNSVRWLVNLYLQCGKWIMTSQSAVVSTWGIDFQINEAWYGLTKCRYTHDALWLEIAIFLIGKCWLELRLVLKTPSCGRGYVQLINLSSSFFIATAHNLCISVGVCLLKCILA